MSFGPSKSCCFLALFLLFCQVDGALGAEVVFVDPELRFAVIDQGNLQGIGVNSNVCVLDATGFILSCGAVIIAKRNMGAIKLPPEEMRRLRVGLKVSLKPIYLKDEKPPGALKGQPDVFRPALVRPESLAGPVQSAANSKERELSAAAQRADPPPADGAPGQAVEGQALPHDAKDPFADLAKLYNALTFGDKVENNNRLREERRIARTPPPVRSFSLHPLLLAPLLNPVTYNDLAFDEIERDQPESASIWDTTPAAKRTKGGMGILARFEGSKDKVYTLGWRYLNFNKREVRTVLDEAYPDISATSTTKADATGIWAERSFNVNRTGSFSTEVGLGGDLFFSDLTFESAYLQEGATNSLGDGVIAFARSRLVVVSLRTSITQYFRIGPGFFSAGLGVLVPLTAVRKSFSGEEHPPPTSTFRGDPEDDLQDSLDHRTTRFAADAHLALGMAL